MPGALGILQTSFIPPFPDPTSYRTWAEKKWHRFIPAPSLGEVCRSGYCRGM